MPCASDAVAVSRYVPGRRPRRPPTGNATVAGTLDEIDRVLLDIAHGPSEVSQKELDGLRERLKAEGILFKIRVLGSKVRTQEGNDAPAVPNGRRAL